MLWSRRVARWCVAITMVMSSSACSVVDSARSASREAADQVTPAPVGTTVCEPVVSCQTPTDSWGDAVAPMTVDAPVPEVEHVAAPARLAEAVDLAISQWDPAVTAADPAPASIAAVDPPRPLVPVLQPVERIGRVLVIGDSLLADGSIRVRGRENTVVDRIAKIVHASPGLAGIGIENRAMPGLAIKYALDLGANSDRDTLGEYLPRVIAEGLDATDVVVIAPSSIDLNVMADRRIDDVATELVDELRRWYVELTATGAQVAFVPVLGVNDGVHDDLRATLGLAPWSVPMSERIAAFNAMLADAGLPLLLSRLVGLDPNQDGRIDRSFFVDYDTRPDGWPDDGIHPNHFGEAMYGSELGEALALNLRWATDPAFRSS